MANSTTTNGAVNRVAETGKGDKKASEIVITPPKLIQVRFVIEGTAPLVQNKFSQKAKQKIMSDQAAGSTAKTKKAREPKDFSELVEGAKHYSHEGWIGIPAPAFRNALISACRLVGFVMTRAKLSLFIVADGFDRDEATPLVRITKGEPSGIESPVRNASGVVDIRARPMWSPGWRAEPVVRFDADQFTIADVSNLLSRAGQQVGIGEGRPDSKSSNGQDWGLFKIINETEVTGAEDEPK